MKLIMDERLKHRLVGLAVILSLGVIFVPALIKKSNQHFHGSLNVSVELPPKPALPKVILLNEQAMFKAAEAEEVKLPAIPIPQVAVQSLAKAKPLSQNKVFLPAIPLLAKANLTSQSNLINASKRNASVNVGETKFIQNGYAIQLGTFSKFVNADALVKKLRQKGYRADYHKVIANKQLYYKVVVGQMRKKIQAQVLQKQLARVTQIKGVIVTTGIS